MLIALKKLANAVVVLVLLISIIIGIPWTTTHPRFKIAVSGTATTATALLDNGATLTLAAAARPAFFEDPQFERRLEVCTPPPVSRCHAEWLVSGQRITLFWGNLYRRKDGIFVFVDNYAMLEINPITSEMRAYSVHEERAARTNPGSFTCLSRSPEPISNPDAQYSPFFREFQYLGRFGSWPDRDRGFHFIDPTEDRERLCSDFLRG